MSDPFYGTPAGLAAYVTARDLSVPTEDDATVNTWLLRASEWIDGRYRTAFPGIKVLLRQQIRQWPRMGGVDVDGYPIDSASVPSEVENATYEAAIQIANGNALYVSYSVPQYKQARVEGAVSVTYNTTLTAADVQPSFAEIDAILQTILTGFDLRSGVSGGAYR